MKSVLEEKRMKRQGRRGCGQGLTHGGERSKTIALDTYFLLTRDFGGESQSFLGSISSCIPGGGTISGYKRHVA